MALTCCQSRVFFYSILISFSLWLYVSAYLPSRRGPPAPAPRALADYKPTTWSRLRALAWSLHLAPAALSSRATTR